jgi:hypothetical protein
MQYALSVLQKKVQIKTAAHIVETQIRGAKQNIRKHTPFH